MSYKSSFLRKSIYQREEELKEEPEQEPAVMPEQLQKYEEMDPELRKYEARRRITRIVAMRIAIAVLLIWVIFRFELPTAMIAVLIGVIVLILGTLVPIISALRTSLRYEDEDEEK